MPFIEGAAFNPGRLMVRKIRYIGLVIMFPSNKEIECASMAVISSCQQTGYCLDGKLVTSIIDLLFIIPVACVCCRRLLCHSVMSPLSFACLAESAEIRGEIGGNVTFTCPVDEGENITFFYLQKNGVFVNGFHRDHDLEEAWNNTRVVKGITIVEMFHLNASHNGEYQCIISYEEGSVPETTKIHLIVTANYSTPTFNKSRVDDVCHVSCATDGGYPCTNLTLDCVDCGDIALDVRSGPNQPDPNTGLWRLSSEASYDCSDGERKLGCSASGVTAYCDPDVDSYHNRVVIGVSLFAGVLIVGVLIGIWKQRQIKSK
ncbi:uncharacterized protein [Nerophis lumbriciformis]|uniref:uncharacterized protein isoform X2 n=1 Tax=Nerophis lumbriciformis TaxID=546530 RepID=UPI002ADF78BE|nr:uncharacterized protein LOC133572828 isoform X2 [Nerophis lumbriciformis]